MGNLHDEVSRLIFPIMHWQLVFTGWSSNEIVLTVLGIYECKLMHIKIKQIIESFSSIELYRGQKVCPSPTQAGVSCLFKINYKVFLPQKTLEETDIREDKIRQLTPNSNL